jgi:hypothetical protein
VADVWRVTQLGVSLAFPVELLGSRSHPDAFAQRMLTGGVGVLLADTLVDYGVSCSSLLVQNGRQSPPPTSASVSIMIVNVRPPPPHPRVQSQG